MGKTAQNSLIVLYTLTIAVGVVTNIAIVYAFLSKKVLNVLTMLSTINLIKDLMTTRNVFIANLALSDILLCTFTMPLTLVDLLTNHWALGENLVR